MAAIAFSMLGRDDSEPDDRPLRLRFRHWRQGTFTWLNIRRTAGLMVLLWEAVVDKLDQPAVVVLVCSLLFGVEALDKFFGKGDR